MSARMMAPILAMAATFAVRRVMDSRYRHAVEEPVPAPNDLTVTFKRTLLWSLLTAVVTSAIEVAVVRGVTQAGAHEVSEGPSS